MIKCITFNDAAKLAIPDDVRSKMKNDRKQAELDARASIASDLFREGKITRVETFRSEVDAALGENTGNLNFKDNTDFIDDTM